MPQLMVSLGKVATQSNTSYGDVASRAIDGDTNGAFGGNSVIATLIELDPWWEVDLGDD